MKAGQQKASRRGRWRFQAGSPGLPMRGRLSCVPSRAEMQFTRLGHGMTAWKRHHQRVPLLHTLRRLRNIVCEPGHSLEPVTAGHGPDGQWRQWPTPLLSHGPSSLPRLAANQATCSSDSTCSSLSSKAHCYRENLKCTESWCKVAHYIILTPYINSQ